MKKPLIDPDCLCGQPHPCEAHGAWVGTPLHRRTILNPLGLLRSISDHDDIYYETDREDLLA